MRDELHLDTNVVMLAMGGDRRLSSFIHGKFPVISEIVEMELRCYPLAKSEDEARISEFLDKARIRHMDERVKGEAVRIRRFHRLKLLDAIVAASAKVDRLPLLTADGIFTKLSSEQGIMHYQTRRG
ncbi:MAG: PIN domain-containing protein [Flavobacteriales bacterium]|nr:PIN domain-containing protein [Flavobacteriales bacterium]